MNAWRVFVGGTILFVCAGIALTFLGDKAHFLKWLTTHRHPVWDHYFYQVTKLGEYMAFVVIGLMLWFQSWKKMILIPLLGGVVTLMTYILKKIFYEERPWLYLKRSGWDGPMAVLDYHLLTGHSSFPSGHSMAAWALFTLAAALIRKVWVSILCLILAASVSISRVYLMAHFLRDVIAGAVIGFSLGYIFYFLFKKYLDKKPSLDKSISETQNAQI